MEDILTYYKEEPIDFLHGEITRHGELYEADDHEVSVFKHLSQDNSLCLLHAKNVRVGYVLKSYAVYAAMVEGKTVYYCDNVSRGRVKQAERHVMNILTGMIQLDAGSASMDKEEGTITFENGGEIVFAPTDRADFDTVILRFVGDHVQEFHDTYTKIGVDKDTQVVLSSVCVPKSGKSIGDADLYAWFDSVWKNFPLKFFSWTFIDSDPKFKKRQISRIGKKNFARYFDRLEY